MYRCSNSNRVAAALSATNSSTTSLARSGSASNFPIRLQVPRKHHPPRRIPQQHSSPLAFRSVAVPLVPPPALFLLHHDLVERLERYVVRRWHHCPIFSTNTRNAFSMDTLRGSFALPRPSVRLLRDTCFCSFRYSSSTNFLNAFNAWSHKFAK